MNLKFFATVIICAVIFLCGGKTQAAEFELVSYSAQVKLQWLANTGMPEAKKILQELGTANIYGKKNLKDYKRLELLNGIYQELCYASTAEYVKTKNYKNVMDIGGGYTPRAVVMVNDGRKYIGAELNAVALSAIHIMPKFINAKYKNNLSYEDVPVEDRNSMITTANQFKGELCIIEDGLQIYLTRERTDAMFTLIHEILKNHGGCFITSDFVTKEMFKELAAAVYGENAAQPLYDETKAMYENLFGEPLKDNTFKSQDEALKFLQSKGFNVQQVPLVIDTSKLYSLKNLTPEQAEKVKQVCAKNYLWVITAK
ncbi:MAG: hypothetical protein IJQ16_08660 [Selenomonadaceae bacterium]|nr:hypothetical protein [Selenomonadaceae bacterium]